jgi:hypothetical protein
MSKNDLLKEHAIHEAKFGDADDILALREFYPELGEVLMVVYSAMHTRDVAQQDLAETRQALKEVREELHKVLRNE